MDIEKNLYPKISISLAQAYIAFPAFLLKNFAHVLQRIEFLWGEADDYLKSLIIMGVTDDKSLTRRTNRHGFPLEAMQEITQLKQIHQQLFPSTNSDSHESYTDSELVPLQTSAQIDTHPAISPIRDTHDRSDIAQTEASNINSSRSINWPVIRTQHELAEIAELQHRGKNIYSLQGKPAGEILKFYGVIDEYNLNAVLVMQKSSAQKNQSLGEILIGVGLIKQEELTRTLLIQGGIPMVDLFSIDIPANTSNITSHANARDKMVVPVGNYHNTLYLAVADPFTFTDQAFFTMMTGMKIGLVFAPVNEIMNHLNIYGSGKKIASKEQFHYHAKREMDSPPLQATEVVTTTVSENDSVIVNLVNQMLLNAIHDEASDIHIEIYNDGEDACIRFRRDGNMAHFADFPRAYHKAVVSRIKIMSGLDISEMRRPQDGKISFDVPNEGSHELRVVTIPTMPGIEFVTIRILSSGGPSSLANLGMANRDVQIFREVFQRPYGLILVCGPTGSGKTTTLHSILKELNTENRKIWTAEDPVEIVQPHLAQVQINSKAGMTFASMLRSFLRADPDIIMIGEMRDHETAKIAVEASMTGHLVLSTLHANSAFETVARLQDLGIDPYNLSDALQAILAQRLARKLCTVCARREEADISDIEDLADEYYQAVHIQPPTPLERDEIIQRWREKSGVNGRLYLMHPVGCELCDGGYKGRIGLYELLHATPALRHLIRQRSAASEYMAAGIANGMLTLKQDGIEKVIRGITDMMQVHGACY